MKLSIALIAAMATIASFHPVPAFAHEGHHTYLLVEDIDSVPPDIRRWIEGLKDRNGVGCCSTADGYPAEAEYDRDSEKYRVRINGAWYDVPDVAVVTDGNKLGYAMVWYYHVDGVPTVRCFIAGTMS